MTHSPARLFGTFASSGVGTLWLPWKKLLFDLVELHYLFEAAVSALFRPRLFRRCDEN